MSKGVIIFASRTGNTKNVSEQLKTRLDGEFDLINIAENKKVDIDQYEKIVIGSYMRRRNADPDVMDFVARNKDKLLKKKLFIFVSAGEIDEDYSREIRDSFPKEILEKVNVANIGAIFSIDKLSFVDKVMIQEMAKRQGKRIDELNSYQEDKLDQLAAQINAIEWQQSE